MFIIDRPRDQPQPLLELICRGIDPKEARERVFEMMDDSARARLMDTLPTLRKRIQKIQNRKENIGEQNTKAALIDPLLSALGWEVEDIDEVSREYRRKPQDNPVDYALFMLRSPRLFVEAKDLGPRS